MLKNLNRIHSKMTTTLTQVKKLEEKNVKLIRKMSSFDNIYFDIYKMLIKEDKWSEYERRLRKLQSQLICTTMILKSEKYRDMIKKHLMKRNRFIIVKEYVISKEVHIFKELRQEIERLREKYAQQNSRKYSKKRVNTRKFKFLKDKKKRRQKTKRLLESKQKQWNTQDSNLCKFKKWKFHHSNRNQWHDDHCLSEHWNHWKFYIIKISMQNTIEIEANNVISNVEHQWWSSQRSN